MNREPIKSFEDLDCWKACRSLRVFVAKKFFKALPGEERYRLGDQILRSACSATSNIAEGYGRFHYLDNAKFCSNARGSCWETLDHMITAVDEGIASEELLNEGREIASHAIALLNGYIAYLRKADREKGNHQ
ncbi:MAG: four helix bundle protein [Verrucomicrobia bacterium]|nr:four helix bundle protein [Verrucomicrobiota bacterium]